MRKNDFCYEQSKKREILPNWKNKRTSNFDQKRKGFKSNKNFASNSKNFSKNNDEGEYFKNKTQKNSTAPKGRDMPNNFVKNNEHKKPVKCWEWQGPHYPKYFPKRKGNFNNVHTIQEEEKFGDVENEIPKITATLENQQMDH